MDPLQWRIHGRGGDRPLETVCAENAAPKCGLAIDSCVHGHIGTDGSSVMASNVVVLYAKSRRQQLMLLDFRALVMRLIYLWQGHHRFSVFETPSEPSRTLCLFLML